MKALLTTLMALFLVVGITKQTNASETGSDTGLPLPRMVSLRSGLVNMRSGPGRRYPIEWIYTQKGAPVEIVTEFELWRKVRDWEGSESWVHKQMLTSRRFAKITNPGENNIYAKPEISSRIVAKVEDGVVGEIEKCPSPQGMCLIKFDNIRGWMPRNSFFGLYKNEVIK